MKAVTARSLSDSFDQIEIVDKDRPEPGLGQVRVKMLKAAINPSDMNFIHGKYLSALQRLLWNHNQDIVCFDPARLQPYPELPYTLGGEGVGIVDACGKGMMAKRLLGKRVAISAGPPNGSWQEYVVLDAKRAVPVPDELSDQQAAMYIINPLSCYAIVRKVLGLKKGQWLLQSAAASAMGKNVIRLSQEYGFKTINIVRRPEQKQELIALGASHVIVTDDENLLDRVHKITQGRGVNAAMDCVGGELASNMSRCLGVGAKLALYGTLADEPMVLPSRDLMMPGASVEGFFAGSWLAQQSTISLISSFRQLAKLSRQGCFESKVEREYPLADISDALIASSKQGRAGKILLNISSRD